MKRVLSVAALALAGSTTLVACGGSAPTDASEDDFCSSVENALTSVGEQADKEGDDEIDTGDAVSELEETGTPEGIPDDAREGFEGLIEALKDVDGKTADEAEDIDDPTDGDEGEAFGTYYADTCIA